MEKLCSKCLETKEIDDFHKSNMTNDKRQAFCKICNKNSTTTERRVEYNKRRQARRAEESYKLREAAHGKRNRIERRINYLLKGIRARCVKQNIPFDLCSDDVVVPERCPILNIPLTKDTMEMGDWNAPSIDRIIPELGYVKGNILVMSRKANTMKNNATFEELTSFCTNMLEFIKKQTEINE